MLINSEHSYTESLLKDIISKNKHSSESWLKVFPHSKPSGARRVRDEMEKLHIVFLAMAVCFYIENFVTIIE